MGVAAFWREKDKEPLAKRWVNFMARQPVWIDDQSGFVRSNNFLILRLDFCGFEVTLVGR